MPEANTPAANVLALPRRVRGGTATPQPINLEHAQRQAHVRQLSLQAAEHRLGAQQRMHTALDAASKDGYFRGHEAGWWACARRWLPLAAGLGLLCGAAGVAAIIKLSSGL